MPDQPPHVLIVDDDREICALIKQYLEQYDFTVDVAHDGAAGKRALLDAAFDLILLDVMLPRQSGLDLCREIRTQSDVPIIMLTAVGQLADKVLGLELGADDYVAKPFEPRELLARIRAVLRRRGSLRKPTETTAPEVYRTGGMTVDAEARTVTTAGGAGVALTFAEFELLLTLLRHANQPLSRTKVLQLVLGKSSNVYDRSVDVLVSRLRSKLAADGIALTLDSVRGVGYMLVGQVARA